MNTSDLMVRRVPGASAKSEASRPGAHYRLDLLGFASEWRTGVAWLVVLFLFAGVAALAYGNREQDNFLYHLSRQLLLLPILASALLLGRTTTLFVSCSVTCLFIPDLARLIYAGGLSHPTLELAADMAVYLVLPDLTARLVQFRKRNAALLGPGRQLEKEDCGKDDLRRILSRVLAESVRLNGIEDGRFILSKELGAPLSPGNTVEVGPGGDDVDAGIEPSLLRWLIEQEDVLSVPDLASDPRFALPPGLARRRPAVLALPLVGKADLIGFLVLTKTNGRRFDREEIEMWRALSDRAALLIENVWLYAHAHINDPAKASPSELSGLDLISMVSHELRRPITNIGLTAELLAESDQELPERKEMLEAMNRESSRLTRLVEQVLEAASLDQGTEEPVLEPVALIPLAEERIRLYRLQHPDHLFEIRADEGPFVALGDPVSVGVILENLIQNAVNYSPAGTTVAIQLERQAEHILISVVDQGIGIPPEQLERIFERFQRIAQPGQKKVRGFGLGLYITRRLVERQGGTIWAESELCKGSCFRFTMRTLKDRMDEEKDTDH